MTGARADRVVGETLARLGVEQVFGVIGSGNLVTTNALVAGGARFVAARHECGAVTMADAYARVTGRVGVCSVHQGPGLTNAMTGITEAAKSRTPLVVLAGDTPAAALRSNFRVDQAGMVAAVGAVPERLYSGASAAADTVRAFVRAAEERRTVVLMLPLDVQLEDSPPQTLIRAPTRLRPGPGADAVLAMADLFETASRPLLLAGRGAVLDSGREALERLAERTGALLATSAVGNGLFAGNPWSLGISGGFATPLAAELAPEADLVVGFGASLNRWTTKDGRMIGERADVVQVDLDQEALGAHRPVRLGVVGGVTETAERVTAELERRGHRSDGWRSPELAERIARGSWRNERYEDVSTSGQDDRIDPRTLSIGLHDALPAARTVAVDSGHFMGYPAMYLDVLDAAGFVFTQAFQSIGLGLASAIGAAVARPDRVTVAALGDGGALMAAPEWETLARLRLPVLVVVYNDAAYGAEVHHFGPMGEPLELVRFPDTDLAAFARGLGLRGVTVRSPGDLGAVTDWLDGAVNGLPDAPLVVDAKVVPTVVADWLSDAFR